MSDDDATPISYMGVTKGTPVLSATGEQLGEVQQVLDEPSLDLFDGMTVATEHGLRFADRDTITEITDKYVKTTFADGAALPEPDAPAVFEVRDLARRKDSFLERLSQIGKHDPDASGFWKRHKDET